MGRLFALSHAKNMQVHFKMFEFKRTDGAVFASISSLAWPTFDLLSDNGVLGHRAVTLMMKGKKDRHN